MCYLIVCCDDTRNTPEWRPSPTFRRLYNVLDKRSEDGAARACYYQAGVGTAEDRPVGVDGLGLNIPQQDTEPELSVRYATSSEPYATSRRGTSASDAPYGW